MSPRGRRGLLWPAGPSLLALLAGLVAGAAVARWVGMPLGKLATMFAVAALGIGAVVALAILLDHELRRRGSAVAKQAALAGAATATAALAGVAAATLVMMPSAHELASVLALLPLCAGVGIAYGLVSARRTAADLEALAATARRLEAGDLTVRAKVGGSAEVAEVAEALSAAAERLGEAFTRERAMEASRRDLVAWASHDLRTPLASLRATAEALADEVVADPAEHRRYLASLVAQVDRLANLVDDLFELSQIEAGALVLNFEPTHLPSLVAEVLEVFEPDAGARGVRLAADLPDSFPLVPAGRDQMGRVLANLVANGVRHTPAGGLVRVAVHARADAAVVEVRDGCGGIPDQDLSRVFDRLWRGDPARSTTGAGLGLAIARGLVEAHRGRIGVRNVGGGCEFTVELPRTGGPPPGSALDGTGRPATRPGTPRTSGRNP